MGEEQPWIAASDKDFKPNFNKMIRFCTVYAFTTFAEISGCDQKYKEDEINQLNNEE